MPDFRLLQSVQSSPSILETEYYFWGFPSGSVVKKKKIPMLMQEMYVPCLDREDSLEEEMGTHSSILAWKIPWTEEPGGLQSMGFQRVGHDWATEHTHSLYLFCSLYLLISSQYGSNQTISCFLIFFKHLFIYLAMLCLRPGVLDLSLQCAAL